jgi:hypothetical protein
LMLFSKATVNSTFSLPVPMDFSGDFVLYFKKQVSSSFD